jgi:thiamine-monophosphate kinase
MMYVTGSLGAAEAGRIMLAESQGRAPRWSGPLVQRHLRPMPRLGVMRLLGQRLHALIDMSDGLATDARHIAEASRVRIEVDAERLPILPETARFCTERGLDPGRFALSAGEDYELLFAASEGLPPSVAGTPVTPVGSVKRGTGLWAVGGVRARLLNVSGFDHFTTAVQRRRRSCG